MFRFNMGDKIYYHDKHGNTVPAEVLATETRHDDRLWLRVNNFNTKPVWVLASNCELQSEKP